MGIGAGRNVASADMVMSSLRRELHARAVSLDTGRSNLGGKEKAEKVPASVMVWAENSRLNQALTMIFVIG